MTYEVVIRMKLPGFNEIININRTNRYAAATMKKKIQTEISWFLSRLPRLDKPMKIHFLWVEPNARRDFDNICAGGRKFILDAMQESGKLPNDNRKYIVGFTDEFAVDKKDPRIEMRIEEV